MHTQSRRFTTKALRSHSKALISHPKPSVRSPTPFNHRPTDSAHDIGTPVLGDDPDDEPAHLLEHLQPVNVVDVPPPVSLVLVAFIFDADHELLPAHTDLSDWNTVGAQHRYLGLRPRESRFDEKQPKVALPGRLCARIDEFERGFQSP